MATEKKSQDVKLRFFNVVIQPSNKHEKENYENMMQHVCEKNIPYNTSHDKYTKIYTFSKTKDLMYGTLVNYTVINGEDPWYNSSNGALQTLEIDPNLNPNAKEWDFYFYPEKHRIAVASKRGVSFTQILSYFRQVFRDAAAVLGFEDVVVSYESTSECIDDIFGLDDIDTLTIEVSYSNNGNFDEFDTAIDEELKGQNVGNVKTMLKSSRHGKISLKPDSYFGGLVRLSKSHGSAKAEGHLNGRVKKVNTDDYPKEVIMKKVTEENKLSKVISAILSIL